MNGTKRFSLAAEARMAALMLLLGVAYFLTARLSTQFTFYQAQLGLVWAPNAIVLAALVLTKRHRWWIPLAVAAAAHVLALGPWTATWKLAWQIAANFVCIVAAAEALRRLIGFPLRFETRRNVLVYAATVLCASLFVGVASPGLTRLLLGFDLYFSPSITILRLTLASLAPLLLVTPAIVSFAGLLEQRLSAVSQRRAWEIGAILGTVLVASLVALDSHAPPSALPWLLLLTFPPLTWAAVRLGPAGASLSLLLVAALSVFGSMMNLGVFVETAPRVIVLWIEIYWIVIAPPTMLLAASMTERVALEHTMHDLRNQLAHAARVAAASELSVTIAHELRQPMTAILANAEAGLRLLARDSACNLDDIREILQDISDQDRRAADVISGLRTLLKDVPMKRDVIALDSVVRDALHLTRPSLARAGIEVQEHIPSWLPRVNGDHVQLTQVVVNLVMNGCDSMAHLTGTDRILELRLWSAGSDRVEVSVKDSGIGLPTNGEDRVFEPFFTTKSEGLGLGLSVGRSIASAHGGRLWAENNFRRHGATFHFELPAVSEARQPALV